MKKKILFFTGTRAEFGLLSGLIHQFLNDEKYQTEILVSGMHLEEKFGYTLNEITQSGFIATYKVPIDLFEDSKMSTVRSMGKGLVGYAEVVSDAQPDLAFVLGDRFESFSFVSACQVIGIPVAHIHGGEVTEGAIDDAFRHAMTKMSHVHFTSAEVHSQRIVQMGESPSFVFNVGALGVDNCLQINKIERKELEKELGIVFKEDSYLVTFHPETISNQTIESQIEEFLAGLQTQIKFQPIFVITLPNTDPGHSVIIDKILSWASLYPECVKVFKNLGLLRYLSIMSCVKAVLGNSSSGLIEAPAMKVATINVGDRQKGRLQGNSIINVPCERKAIEKAFLKLEKQDPNGIESVYGYGGTAQSIKSIVDQIINDISLRKVFYDRH